MSESRKPGFVPQIRAFKATDKPTSDIATTRPGGFLNRELPSRPSLGPSLFTIVMISGARCGSPSRTTWVTTSPFLRGGFWERVHRLKSHPSLIARPSCTHGREPSIALAHTPRASYSDMGGD
jgi:hypothetical protein